MTLESYPSILITMIWVTINNFRVLDLFFSDCKIQDNSFIFSKLFQLEDYPSLISSNSSITDAFVSYLTDETMDKSAENEQRRATIFIEKYSILSDGTFSRLLAKVRFLDLKDFDQLYTELINLFHKVNLSPKTLKGISFLLYFVTDAASSCISNKEQVLKKCLIMFDRIIDSKHLLNEEVVEDDEQNNPLSFVCYFFKLRISFKLLLVCPAPNLVAEVISTMNLLLSIGGPQIKHSCIKMLHTHIVSLLGEKSNAVKSRDNWKGVLSIIESTNQSIYDDELECLQAIESCIIEILLNLKNELELYTSTGLIMDFSMSLIEFYITSKKGIISPQKAVSSFIQLSDVLSAADQLNQNQTEHFKYSIFGIQTMIRRMVDIEFLDPFLGFNVLQLTLMKIDCNLMNKYELQIILNSLSMLALAKAISPVPSPEFFELYSKIISTVASRLVKEQLLNQMLIKFFVCYSDICKSLNPIHENTLISLKSSAKELLDKMLGYKYISKKRHGLLQSPGLKIWNELRSLVEKRAGVQYTDFFN